MAGQTKTHQALGGSTDPGHPTRPGPTRDADSRRPRPESGDILSGRFRYRLLRQLGDGGFGSVFLARSLDLAEGGLDAPPAEVAVKILGPANDSTAKSFLKRELAALLAIRHDRIPSVYDWNLEGDNAFVVLEYYASGSLADARTFLPRLNEDQTWRLISDLLSALTAAHRASILHLDVKPSNVLLDGNGGYVLTDFGVSHASRMSKGLLHQGRIAIGLGTHGYRAPEQESTRIQTFDLRTDLWGVGATAWSMYTGVDLNKRQDVLRKKEGGNVYGLPRLSDVRLHCPPELEEVVMSLLSIDPADRPGGASEVLNNIRAIADGFGLGTRAITAARRSEISAKERSAVIDGLVDPLWASICRAPGFERFVSRYDAGETLPCGGERSYNAMLLLRGEIAIERDGKQVDVEKREGALLGAISILTGATSNATLRALNETWICLFNEAELEQLLTCNPAVALRMIRSFATQIVEGPPRQPSASGASHTPDEPGSP